MSEHPLNIVVGSPVKDGKCLFIRRNKDPYKDYWSLPGGKLEYGEDISKAIERELKEETNLTVKFDGLRGIVSEVLKERGTNTIQGHFLMWVCALQHVNGEPKEQQEGKVQWFDEERLTREKHTVIPSDYLMAKKFLFGVTPPTSFHTVRMLSTDSGYEIEHTDL